MSLRPVRLPTPKTGAAPPEFAPIGARRSPLLETTSGVAITPLDALRRGSGRFSAPAITACAGGRQIGSHLWPRTPRKTGSCDSEGHADILQSALATGATVHNPAFQRSFYGQIMSQKYVKNRVKPGAPHRVWEPRHGGGRTAPKSTCSQALLQPRPLPNLEGEQRFINWAKIRSSFDGLQGLHGMGKL